MTMALNKTAVNGCCKQSSAVQQEGVLLNKIYQLKSLQFTFFSSVLPFWNISSC